MYANSRQSHDHGVDKPDGYDEDEITAALEHSIATIERQKGIVQEAIQPRALCLTSSRGLRTDEGINNVREDDCGCSGSRSSAREQSFSSYCL